MNKVNFLAKENFPQSTHTFDFLQKMIHLAGNMALLGGDNYILSGCVDDQDGNVSEGLIVINGELLAFVGGAKKSKIKIQETKESDHFNGVDYPEAYIHRKVGFDDDGDILWDDLKQVLTNKALEERFSSIKGDAPGTVKMWAGQISKIPDDYMLCDGRPLEKSKYPELDRNLDSIYGVEGNNNFKLPDLRKRFIVGFDNADEEYKHQGGTGGSKDVTLTTDQIPSHSHDFDGVRTDSNNWRGTGEAIGSWTVYGNSMQTSTAGGGQSHENRPPYFVLAYIIKVK